MKRITNFFRVLLAASIAVASLPVQAIEMVCVVGPQKAAVPMASCQAPCCGHGTMAKATCDKPAQAKLATLPPCCKGKHGKTELLPAKSYCAVGGMSCRCETRITSSHPAVTAVLSHRVTLPLHQVPAILPDRPELSLVSLDWIEPGIFGVDSGPPLKVERSPKQSRAPPIA